jgi:Asp-tRNA(Asn)/Glu-tRNA(Gln) amidotransferase A subunit family amidase
MHTIASAAAAIRQGKLTPVDLLIQCLERIDHLEERVRAWVFVDRDRARADAVRLHHELKRGTDRGPLHGIPIGVKDLYDVFDWPTAAGSKRWAQSYARQDAPAIMQLRQAGAVFVGKTVTTAYAAFDPPVTKNPWRADRTPGGSSSGSAVAVACGMVPAALGTQTGGSITRPASFCGVYGFKPTYGRVSLDGVVPLSRSLDHAGVIAGSVRDCAMVLQPMLREGAGPGVRDLLSNVEAPGPRRLLALGSLFRDQADPVMKEAFGALIERLRQKGWEIIPRPLPPSFADVPKNHRTVMAVEAAEYHGERWKRNPADYPPKFTALIEEGLATSAPEYIRCRAHLNAVREETTRWTSGGQFGIVPATVGPAPDPSTIGHPLFQAPWSYSGLPTISLPFAWTDDGLPLCLQVVGPGFWEADLVGMAAAVEADIGFERREVPE